MELKLRACVFVICRQVEWSKVGTLASCKTALYKDDIIIKKFESVACAGAEFDIATPINYFGVESGMESNHGTRAERTEP